MQQNRIRERRTPARSRTTAAGADVSRQGQPQSRVRERVSLVDGRRVHMLVSGAGEPVVLVHGLLGTANGWSGVMEQLAGEYRLYAPDALGMGRSERMQHPDAGLAASAKRLARWMDAEGIESADLVGTSHGGAVAMQFAATFPQRVRRLVLHAPANPFCVHSRPQIRFCCTRAGRLTARFLPHGPAWLHQLALARMYGDPARIAPEALVRYVTSLQVPGTVDYVLDILLKWRRDMRMLRGVLERLGSLPVLLLWGDRDRAVSLESAYRLRSVLGSALQVLPGLGHLPFEEDPAAFAAPLRAFLAVEPNAQRLTA